MYRVGIFLLLLVVVSEITHSQDADQSDASDSRKAKPVRFVPPSDMVEFKTVETAGTEEVHRLKGPRSQASQEKVLGIPIKNVSGQSLTVSNINLGCGCMTAISKKLEIDSGETTMLYLRVTPKEVGRFAKRITISFENASSVTCVIESVVHSAFEITPNTMVLVPGREKGSELSIRSEFAHTGFQVRSMNPRLTVKFDRQKKDGTHVYRCWLGKETDKDKPLDEFVAPINIEYLKKSYEYKLQVKNAFTVKVQPSIVFASRDKQSSEVAKFHVLVGCWTGRDNLICRVAKPKKGIDLQEIERKPLGESSIFEQVSFALEGDLENIDDVTINWFRGNQIVGTCNVFLDSQSEVAIAQIREKRRERNRQLIEQGNAESLQPAE